ncbi:hypothetical protein GC105_00230 [Alkalibaculum sp. M08DMB]|uniref:Uncharacterized protein n=1 Tax=Alkalibaculum sporogenes TaxID=2655001 RepID=A0A6A7K4H7_9FIRM|nr:hypothetical protein [Alkalibaculum sporogenes]MPW24224.1 hypothetical protein [Alkalibaculum sporogenes]
MKVKKILAGLIALILIGLILINANAFVGNPISKILVNQAAQKYVEDNYSNLDLELEKASYNFKDGNYYVYAKSKTSIDTHFSINFTGMGKFIYDNYKTDVIEKFNTWERVNTLYHDLVDTVVKNYSNNNIAYGEIFDKSDGFQELELDKDYDIKKMAREKGHIVIYLTSDKLNEEILTQKLLEVKKLFDQKEIPFYSIDFTLEAPFSEDEKRRESINIINFLYQDIHEDGLQERVNENINKTIEYYEEMDKENENEL